MRLLRFIAHRLDFVACFPADAPCQLVNACLGLRFVSVRPWLHCRLGQPPSISAASPRPTAAISPHVHSCPFLALALSMLRAAFASALSSSRAFFASSRAALIFGAYFLAELLRKTCNVQLRLCFMRIPSRVHGLPHQIESGLVVQMPFASS